MATTTCIVVPCFNEAKRLDPAAFIRFASRAPDVRLLFVDDGSTDGTAGVLERLCAERAGQIERLAFRSNRGKAEAVRAGMLRAIAMGAGYAGYWDADLSTPLDAAHRFTRILDDAPWLELVMGARVQLLGRRIERRALRHYFGRGFATAASLTVGLPIYDTQCGAKLFRVTPGVAAVFAQPFISRWAFDVEILARLVHDRRGTRLSSAEEIIREEPLAEWRDVAGSKLTTTAWLRTGLDLMRIARTKARWRVDRAARTNATQLSMPPAAPVISETGWWRGDSRLETRDSEPVSNQLWAPELYRLHANAEHAHWWFRARRRILTRIAQRILGDARATVVDVGCGTGASIAALAASYACTGIDPSPDAIRLARERHPNVTFIAGHAPDDLPARSRDADLITLTDVLEHVDHDRALLAALIEWARPGTHLLITVPADPSLWSAHDVVLGHRRRYDAEGLARLWDGLPVSLRMLSHFNARLYPAVRAVRAIGRKLGRSAGECGTDVAVPPRPLNAVLERVFAGESERLIAALDRGGRPAYRRGASLIAVLCREDPLTRPCITPLQCGGAAALQSAPAPAPRARPGDGHPMSRNRPSGRGRDALDQ